MAVVLAEELGAQIVSTDSMQVYRGMDIGTAKSDPATRLRVPHHMIDICDPDQDYSVAEFQRTGRNVLDRLDEAGHRAIIAGGSGLHFRALVDPYEFPPTDPGLRAELEAASVDELRSELVAADPGAANLVDMANPRRVVRAVEVLRLTGATPSARAAGVDAAAVRDYEAQRPLIVLGFDPGDLLPGRVSERFEAMLEAGLVEEVSGLVGRLGPTARQAVGYKELLEHVEGRVLLDVAVEAALNATTALARRQRTFFRRDPRVQWLAWHDDAQERAAIAAAALEEVPWTS